MILSRKRQRTPPAHLRSSSNSGELFFFPIPLCSICEYYYQLWFIDNFFSTFDVGFLHTNLPMNRRFTNVDELNISQNEYSNCSSTPLSHLQFLTQNRKAQVHGSSISRMNNILSSSSKLNKSITMRTPLSNITNGEIPY